MTRREGRAIAQTCLHYGGILVALRFAMATLHTKKSRTNHGRAGEALRMLRWTLSRDGASITCEIGVTERRKFEVCFVPHWDVSASVIEEFNGASRAVTRHAEIVRHLRDAGWTRPTGRVHVNAARL